VKAGGAIPSPHVVREAIRWGASRLEEAGIAGDEAAGEAVVLLSHCAGMAVPRLYAMADGVAPASMRRFEAAIDRRREREPLQYITGTQEFMSLEFRVDRRVLIPRPETEVLVETVVEYLRESDAAGIAGAENAAGAAGNMPRFADVGTGSGAIAVSIARYAGCGGYALDASEGALDVARLNARLHGVDDRLEFLNGDLLEPLAGRIGTAGLDCVVSNPPYITREEFERLQPEIREFEPRIALLCDDLSGLYGRLAQQAARILRPGGLLAVEVGYGQADVVARVFGASGLYGAVDRVKDLRGIDRVVRCNSNKQLHVSSM